MSAGEVVPFERFEEYRQKLNNLREIHPANSSVVEPHDDCEAVAVAAVAVRRPAANEDAPQDFTD